jgi:hypothetical protein
MYTIIRTVTHRAALAATASLCALSSTGCAHPAAAAPVVTAKDTREPASVSLEYEVARKGDEGGVLLRGRTSIDGRHEARVERRARDREEIRFAARERNDGSFDVEMKYREVTPDGVDVMWEPVLHVARGTTATADVAGSGWARTVSLKVD